LAGFVGLLFASNDAGAACAPDEANAVLAQRAVDAFLAACTTFTVGAVGAVGSGHIPATYVASVAL